MPINTREFKEVEKMGKQCIAEAAKLESAVASASGMRLLVSSSSYVWPVMI